jgi:hypothetical protein
MSSFFETHKPYMDRLQNGFYSIAVDVGIEFLTDTKQFAPDAYENASKGTPFYFLGIAAFLSHDFLTATFLFDAAASEDLRLAPDKKDTPALLAMQLDGGNRNQTALPIVRGVVDKIEAAIASYKGRPGSKPLALSDVRQYFLTRFLTVTDPHRRTMITTFISFFFEWEYRARLIELSQAGSREPFFMHLFRGCLLFESLLKENPKKKPTKDTLGPILTKDLFGELGIPSTLKISCPSFNTIIQSLQPNQTMDKTIECTGKTRNTLGHNLAWVAASLDAPRYNLLVENIAVSCLHAIACLYVL